MESKIKDPGLIANGAGTANISSVPDNVNNSKVHKVATDNALDQDFVLIAGFYRMFGIFRKKNPFKNYPNFSKLITKLNECSWCLLGGGFGGYPSGWQMP